MNKFVRLISATQIEYAKSFIKLDGIIISNPTAQQYLKAGFKKLVDQKLDLIDGMDIVFDKYTEDAEHVYVNYIYQEKQIPTEEGFEVSKIYLRIALMKLGIWDQIVEYMKSTKIMISEDQWINMYDAWNDALVIDTGNELFKPYIQTLKENFKDIISPEQVDEILLQCKAK